MKQCFVPKRFNTKAAGMLGRIETILTDYAKDGLDLSVRQLHYQLVSKNVTPNTQRQYKRLVALVNDARLAGVLDWDHIVDRGRVAYRPRHWANPGDLAKEMAGKFAIDKWADQPYYIEVQVEKQALEGVLLPVCSGLNITFQANKGYSSASAFHQTGARFRRRAEQGKKLVVLYLGDHDPSGIDMTRDVALRVPLLGGEAMNVSMGQLPTPLDIDVKRLALNIAQVRKFKPPENPAKESDSRAAGYKAKFGKSSWELDAVEPRALAKLVTDAVLKLRDQKLWDAAVVREESARKELTKFAKRYDKKGKRKRS